VKENCSMGKNDLEIKVVVPQDKIEKIRHKAEVELESFKKLPVDENRAKHIKYLINKTLIKIHGEISVTVEVYDIGKDELAKTNMTAQVLGILQFLEENKHTKESELKRIQILYGETELPGFKDMEKVHEAGIVKVGKDIANQRKHILKLQKEGKIHQVIWD